MDQGVGYIRKGWFFSRLMHATKGMSIIEAPLSPFMGLMRGPGTKHGYAWFAPT
jgi:hypothetical protein